MALNALTVASSEPQKPSALPMDVAGDLCKQTRAIPGAINNLPINARTLFLPTSALIVDLALRLSVLQEIVAGAPYLMARAGHGVTKSLLKMLNAQSLLPINAQIVLRGISSSVWPVTAAGAPYLLTLGHGVTMYLFKTLNVQTPLPLTALTVVPTESLKHSAKIKAAAGVLYLLELRGHGASITPLPARPTNH